MRVDRGDAADHLVFEFDHYVVAVHDHGVARHVPGLEPDLAGCLVPVARVMASIFMGLAWAPGGFQWISTSLFISSS